MIEKVYRCKSCGFKFKLALTQQELDDALEAVGPEFCGVRKRHSRRFMKM